MIPGLWIGGATAGKYNASGWSNGGPARTGRRAEWCRGDDGLGGYRASGRDKVGEKSFGERVFCGQGVSESNMAAVRTPPNLRQLCFQFDKIRMCGPIHEHLMDGDGWCWRANYPTPLSALFPVTRNSDIWTDPQTFSGR